MPGRTPPKKQKQYYSGKKKRHTQKAQLIIDHKTKAIICVAVGKGSEHDSRLLKRSKSRVLPATVRLGDLGYVGMDKDLVFGKRVRAGKDLLPHKRDSRPGLTKAVRALSAEQKQENKDHARSRIAIDHVNRHLKIFRILCERYRNRRRRFGLRLNLLAAIYNLGYAPNF